MIFGFSRMVAVRRAAAAIGIVALVGSVQVAQASDNAGVQDFLQNMFGGGQSQPQPQYAPAQPQEYAQPAARPLTVRRVHRKRLSIARASAKPMAPGEKVTIYTDKTLEPGDAVMTDKGMRIFNGSESWPYREADFVDISASKRVPAALRKQLTAIDIASRF